MATKTEIINSLRSAGYTDLADSTLKRKSTAELETLLSAVLDSIATGKTGDLNDAETDCGGCENGECDDNSAPVENGDNLYEFMLDLISLGLPGGKEIGQELSKVVKSDGQSKMLKDRDAITSPLETLRQAQKVVTSAAWSKDPKVLAAALQALETTARQVRESL